MSFRLSDCIAVYSWLMSIYSIANLFVYRIKTLWKITLFAYKIFWKDLSYYWVTSFYSNLFGFTQCFDGTFVIFFVTYDCIYSYSHIYVWILILYYKIVIGWFIKSSVKTFQLIIVMYRRGNFVYHHLECTSIYRPLSYPFRSLKTRTMLSICRAALQAFS